MWPTEVRELTVESDYGQIYVYDPGLTTEASLTTEDTEDDNQLSRSLEDAYDTRYDNGLVNILTPSQSGTIVFEASGGGRQIDTTIPPDLYRARISCRGYRLGVGEIEGTEEYLVQLWPAPEAPPKLVKNWPGWDTMRPPEV